MNQSSNSQEFIRATVHLAGRVEYETGSSTRYSAEHVQTRIGSALIYLLDFLAASDFASAVRLGAQRAQGLFVADHLAALPGEVLHAGQDSSVIVRMWGPQSGATAQAISASVNRYRRPYLTCQVGGLVLVMHDAEAVARLVEVAETSLRVAAAVWPVSAALLPEIGRVALVEHQARERTGR